MGSILSEKSDYPFAPKSGAGILIEQWQSFSGDVALWFPSDKHPDLVARALALGVLDRQEWPRWLINADQSELRLHDLEFIGPFLRWPPSQTSTGYYRQETKCCLDYTCIKAANTSVQSPFEKYLNQIMEMDFSAIIDFSGHPKGEVIKKVILHGLAARQRELRRLRCLPVD